MVDQKANPSNDIPDDELGDRSDRSLLRGIHERNEEAAQQLFERYVDRLRALANRHLSTLVSGRVDSEDVTQSIFRTLFRRLQDGQYSVPEGDSIWRLLVTISLNKIRSIGAHHRAAKRDVRKSADVDQGFLSQLSPDNDEVAVNILRMTISEVLGDLTESQRKIIEMRLEGHDVSAIAESLRRSKRTVERTLQGFRTRLNQILNDEGQSDACGHS